MAASFVPLKTSLRLSLNLGIVDGKQTTKSVSLNSIKSAITADEAAALAQTLAPILAYPVTAEIKNNSELVQE